MTSNPVAADLDAAIESLLAGRLRDPHAILGPHPTDGTIVVRAFHPEEHAFDIGAERRFVLFFGDLAKWCVRSTPKPAGRASRARPECSRCDAGAVRACSR